MLGSARNAFTSNKDTNVLRLFIQIIIQTDYLTVSPWWKSREIVWFNIAPNQVIFAVVNKRQAIHGAAFFNNTAEIILLLQEVKTRNLKDIMETQRGNLIL
jgi:hypothetical protein